MTAPATSTDLAASNFPEGFLWGVATSAYQVEGAVDEGGRTPSIWDTFARRPAAILDGTTADLGVDHYHRFRDDVALMAGLGITAYRFSVSWSRLVPDGVGEVNQEGLSFYRALCEELVAAGITPVATLYHWDLPQVLQDRGGWQNPDSVAWFERYAATTHEALGDLVDHWMTINEPWCVAFLGHSAGEHAPGLTDPRASLVVATHVMRAHHAAVATMRSTASEHQLGIVLNLIPSWPASDSDDDLRAAASVDLVQSRLFLDGLVGDEFSPDVHELYESYGVGSALHVPMPRTELDLLGVNYYNVNRVAAAKGAAAMAPWPGSDGATMLPPQGEVTEMGWAFEPHGLSWTLQRVAELRPDLPLMVMENGAAYPDVVTPEGSIDDPERTAYIASHIAAIGDAIDAGADVRGYFVWSLLDNFEWAHGYSKRFGIVHVDHETQERRLKSSAHWYRDFLAR